MVAHEHPVRLLSDYVLNLLAPGERRHVERHLQRCAHCRKLVQQERAMLNDVRQTLRLATQPPVARLSQLMPPPPRSHRHKRLEVLLRPAFAFGILLLLFVGGLHLYGPDPASVPVSVTSTSLAATATLTPTSTVEPMQNDTVLLPEKNFVQSPARPAGTPVVALFAIAHN